MNKNKKLTNRDKQAIETKKRLVQSARDVFLQNGFEKSTISQIRKEAGVGYGTAYVYFKNKDDMFMTVIETVVERFFKVARQPFNPSTKEEAIKQIEGQVEEYLQTALEERPIMIVLKEALGISKLISEQWMLIRNEFIDNITNDIEYSQSHQLVSSKFIPGITARSWYYMNEMFMWDVVENECKDLEEIKKQLTLFYTSALYKN